MTTAMSKSTPIKHIVRTLIITLLVCYFGIIAFLNLPYVQRQLSVIVSRELGELIHTEVSVGNIDLGLLNRIIIQNVHVNDQKGKDLLKISRLSAKFDIPELLHGRIRIHSVQLFGLNARLVRNSLQEQTNFQFILDAFAPKKEKTSKVPLDLRINSVLIRRGEINYDVWSEPETPQKFNANHIGIQGLSATLSLKALTNDSLNVQVKRMSFGEQSGFKVKRLAMKVTGNRKAFHANQVELGLPETTLVIDTLSARYDQFPNLIALQPKVEYMTRLHAHIVPRDLKAFVPALENFREAINLKVELRGKGDFVECSRLHVSNEEQSIVVEARGSAAQWNQKENAVLQGDILQLKATQQGNAWLMHNLTGKEEMPGILERLGNVFFKGSLSGELSRLNTQGTLTTAAGTVNANITMHADTLLKHRSYSGKVSSGELDMGVLLGQEQTWGKTAFDIELQGFRYSGAQTMSYVKGTIYSLTYKQYEYKNITLNGHYQPGGFNGQIALDDPNGNININGSFATRQEVPEYNLTASIRHLRPHALGLSSRFQDADFSVDVAANFHGHSIDDIQGKIGIRNLLVLSSVAEENFSMDHFDIVAENLSADQQQKQIRIRSPFINGQITGNYSYRTVPTSMLKVAQKYVPSLVDKGRKLPETKNNFEFELKVEQSRLYEGILGIPLSLNMPASVTGSVNDMENKIQLRAYLPEFVYGGDYFESGVLLCDNTDEKALKTQVRINKRLKKGAMLNLAAQAYVKGDTLHSTVNWGNNTDATFSGKVQTTTIFKSTEKKGKLAADIIIHPGEVILNDVPWRVHPARIETRPHGIRIRNFLFEHEDQYVKANGVIGKEKEDSCLVDLSNINLQYVMDLIQFHAVDFEGMASGKAVLKHVMEDPELLAELDVENFKLNGALLGKADIIGKWDNKLGGIRLDADIHENENYFTRVNGYISPKMKGLDLNIQAGGTNLAFLKRFVDNIFGDIQGRAFGNVRLFGPFAALDLEGKAKAEASIKVSILNTYFHAQTDSVLIEPGHFAFRSVRMSDNEGHSGWCNGNLNHTKLKNLSYNFRFQTNNMLVYHTEKETPEFPFYGKIYTTGQVHLNGGNNALNVDGTMRTDPQTTFTYVTSTAAEATSNQFITFVDKTPRRKQEEVDTEVYHYMNRFETEEEDEGPETDIHINLQIDATPTATMRIVMDPAAGDNISAKGSGNLRINFYNKGDFQIFGNYNIEEGIYKMSMQNVIRKDFTLQPGGSVSFNGDPKKANLNVQAVYTVNSASLNDLIPDAASNKSNVKVNCLLNLKGNLTAPALSFDLELPTVSDEDRELVKSLTNTEEQMNTQIIYLLGIGKFYTYDYANNANQSDATSSLAFSTLSGQLNNILSQVIDSQNWNFGTNLSTGDKGWTDVEAEAILSGRLLNNRLIINGNFGYRDNPMRNTNFIGDFEAIWLLTKNGEFRLRGYNQTNDRYFTKSTLTTQGIGLIYKKDFTNWRELIDWLMLKNRRNRKRSSKEEKSALPAGEAILNEEGEKE